MQNNLKIFNGQTIPFRFSFKRGGVPLSVADCDFSVVLWTQGSQPSKLQKNDFTTEDNIVFSYELNPTQTRRLGSGVLKMAAKLVDESGKTLLSIEKDCFIIKKHISNEL